MARSAGFRNHQVIPLGDADVQGVLSVGFLRVSFRPERMPGDGKHVAFVHRDVQQPEHEGVAQVRAQHRRARITVHAAAEQPRRVRVVGQTLGKRLGPEIQRPSRGMGPSVEEGHGGHFDRLVGRHLERYGASRFQRDFHRLPRRIPGRDHVHRMRDGVHDVHHQFTETTGDVMADPLRRMNIRDRAGPDPFARFGIMPRGVERLGNHRAHGAVRPGRAPKGVIVPEHAAHVRIHPEPLPHVFHRNDVSDRMRMCQRCVKRESLVADCDDTKHFLPLHVVRSH